MNAPVAAAQIIIAIIPIVGIVMAAVLIFFFLLWRHKQIICQIKTNVYTPIKFSLQNFCLILGLLLFIVGIILTVLFSIIEGLSFVLLGGLVPLGCGLSLILFFIISLKLKNAEKESENDSV